MVPSPVTAKASNKKKSNAGKQTKIAWCSGADDWGEDADFVKVEKMDTEPDEISSSKEENGNVSEEYKEMPNVENTSDDDDSNSMENDLVCGLGQIDMNSPNSSEDPNANCASDMAAGIAKDTPQCDATAVICAEIEGPNETDGVVIVETPQKPERDLIALLKHTPNSASWGSLAKLTDFTLKSYFMSVDVEQKCDNDCYDQYEGSLSADHIRELYQEYKKQDEAALSPSSAASAGAVGGVEDQESYERALPAHGDLIFYEFVSTIQQNPGQILR